jgi:hypothetical protein
MNPRSTKFAIRDADFKLFVVLWNQKMNLVTPDIHLRMADWLEWNWKRGKKNLLMMAFRSSGKSTIAGLFAAWLLYRNRDLRILVLAADFALAQKMVRNVKGIIEKHPLTQDLKPENADQWASDRFTVKRFSVLRDPSMLAKGITANITGSRADIVICDDVEVPNTCDSAEKRLNLRERLGEINYILVPGGTQFYIGTPHTYYSLYADAPRKEIGEEAEFLKNFTRLEIPILNKNGQCAWPERYGDEDIKDIKRQSGPNKFTSQMMLRPINITEGRLDPSLLNIYEDDLDYTKELQTLFLGQKKMISASAWWDPAFGTEKGDKSVVAIIFADEEGNVYLHHLAYIKIDAHGNIDEATQQCRIVAALTKKMYLPSLCVETNGLGKFLPGLLRNEITLAKSPCAVIEHTSRTAKDIRILETFDAVLAARRLFVHHAVLQTPFVMEMQEWRPGSNMKDDGLDAVAGALSQQPVRLKRLYGAGGHVWMRGRETQKAKTDFEI